MANEGAPFVTLMDRFSPFEASFSPNSAYSLCLQDAQLPRSWDMVIFVLTTTMTRPIVANSESAQYSLPLYCGANFVIHMYKPLWPQYSCSIQNDLVSGYCCKLLSLSIVPVGNKLFVLCCIDVMNTRLICDDCTFNCLSCLCPCAVNEPDSHSSLISLHVSSLQPPLHDSSGLDRWTLHIHSCLCW